MIEILFGESEAASMKAAKNTVIHMKADEPTAVFVAEKRKALQKEHGGWIEGTADEVICLGFKLDIGDIEQEVTSEYRKDLIYSLLYQEQWGKDIAMSNEILKLGNTYIEELERLKVFIKSGEHIRIWYSKSPYSICGLYFICYWMRPYNNEISMVELPEYRTEQNTIISYQNWGDVAAEEFSHFLPYQKYISKNEKKMYAQEWTELMADNSPLRVLVNNHIVGTSEEFYDFLVWKILDEKPMKEAMLIGTILGHYPMSIGDWWYAKRIQYFIDRGLIEVLEDSENKYARLIKKK